MGGGGGTQVRDDGHGPIDTQGVISDNFLAKKGSLGGRSEKEGSLAVKLHKIRQLYHFSLFHFLFARAGA